MLSDSLFDAYEALKSDYLHYLLDSEYYSKDVFDEVENILQRMDALRTKLDTSEYRGTYRFDDGGALQRYKIAVLKYQHELVMLAGELSKEVSSEDEVFFTTHSKRMTLAHEKPISEGKKEVLTKLHKKYFGNTTCEK